MNCGYVKFYRKITDWEWYKDGPTFRVFFHLVAKAAFTDRNIEGVKVPRGSLLTSRRKLSAELGLSERKIRTALKHLEMTHEITQQVTHKYSLITVCNYERYQGRFFSSDPVNDPQSDQQVTHYRPTLYNIRREESKNISNVEIEPYNQHTPNDIHIERPDLKKLVRLSTSAYELDQIASDLLKTWKLLYDKKFAPSRVYYSQNGDRRYLTDLLRENPELPPRKIKAKMLMFFYDSRVGFGKYTNDNGTQLSMVRPMVNRFIERFSLISEPSEKVYEMLEELEKNAVV